MATIIVSSSTISTALNVSSGQETYSNSVTGQLSILNGGLSVQDTVYSGGLIVVSSGGVTSGTTLSSGGTLSGATLSGGVLEIMSGRTAGASQINFTLAGGTLQLDQSVLFGVVVSGFGVPGGIDLRDIAFGTGTTLGCADSGGGTLTVSDGTNTATINLLGQYTAANFTKQTDGHAAR